MQVRMVFDEPESGVTIIKLKQTDVPEEDRYVEFIAGIWIGYQFLSSESETPLGLPLQVWELNCGGEHRERLDRAHLSEDTCSVWFWALKISHLDSRCPPFRKSFLPCHRSPCFAASVHFMLIDTQTSRIARIQKYMLPCIHQAELCWTACDVLNS
jgi:hypothetical protein